MNFQLNILNTCLPGDLSNIALGFLQANTICLRPLACGLCGVNQASRLCKGENGVLHCKGCYIVEILKDPTKKAFQVPIYITLFEDAVTGTVERVTMNCPARSFPSPALRLVEERHGFPTHFVRCDDLYWGPAAPGFR